MLTEAHERHELQISRYPHARLDMRTIRIGNHNAWRMLSEHH